MVSVHRGGSLMSRPRPIRCARLQANDERFAHGFFTREGGVSTGIYAGLNTGLGSDDDKHCVAENRNRVLQTLGDETARLATPHQIHSSIAIPVTGPWPDGERPQADAVVTNRPGLALGILTADCGPVLFADAGAGVIGAAHAGWKGAISGVLENTLAAMEALGSRRSDIIAVLGPTISQSAYEVGPEFVDRFVALDPANGTYFKPSRKQGHSMFDLPAYIVGRLARVGIDTQWTGHCTYADGNRFYSYRRTTHRGESDYGRQVSTIMIRG